MAARLWFPPRWPCPYGVGGALSFVGRTGPVGPGGRPPRARVETLALATRAGPAGHSGDAAAAPADRPGLRLRVTPLRRQPDLAAPLLEGRRQIREHEAPLTPLPGSSVGRGPDG